ncbi:hypothetical protein RB195_022783 [Necator americanus]|uniref:Peptidase aspartic putative domain-containing protein n=1 Tax=Necator americanus TaxID=51031 RepID=A0ABR1EH83_NECAM
MTVYTVNTSSNNDPLQSWEDFCTLETNGVEQFEGPLPKERQITDATVLKTFGQTIERKQDGYCVRLPWEKEFVQFPDNKELAVRQLQFFMARMKSNPTATAIAAMVQQMHESQSALPTKKLTKTRNLMMEMLYTTLPGPSSCYNPHKSTIKLRIVFDASAHLNNLPSLNEVLHRGPVVLPKLCDILRVIIGNIAITSDVERAFH